VAKVAKLATSPLAKCPGPERNPPVSRPSGLALLLR
jgi:hypothetical protein